MDLKRAAAREAATWIESRTRLGLGAGSTIAHLVDALAERGVRPEVVSSSGATSALLARRGFSVRELSATSRVDMYFDGCDQFDVELNALKSGGGIHTQEKLLASMAGVFVLLGDASKYVPRLDTRFPIALEVLPDAVRFVTERLQHAYAGAKIARRQAATKDGNALVDLWLPELPPLEGINPALKAIPGVVETSLFYRMAHKAIIAEEDAVNILEPALHH